MQHVGSIIATHPQHPGLIRDELVACLDACLDATQSCAACADACLAEDAVKELVRCIRINLDCADICEVTARLLSRQTSPDTRLVHRQLELCAAACEASANECSRHASMHEHCRVCAEACRVCLHACRDLAGKLGIKPD